MLDNLKYRIPNFRYEWLEANRYPEFQEIGKQGWIEVAKQGKVMKYSTIKDSLGNVDLDFDSLDRDKKERFIETYKKGVVELPIVADFGFEYDLLGGNTRLAGLIKIGHDPKVWVVKVPNQEMNESLKGGVADNMTLLDIAKKHSKGDSTDKMLSNLKKQLHLGMKYELEHSKSRNTAKEIAMDHLSENPHYYTELQKAQIEEDCWKGYEAIGLKKKGKRMVPNCVPKKGDTNEMTGAASAGAFSAPISFTKKDVQEAMDAGISAAAAFDVPLFGATTKGGRKDPLKIDGPESIGKSRAVKDKSFPKFGGPGGIYIKIKDKCKKFPYCNQGDINAIEILRETIEDTAKKHGLPIGEVEKIVLKGIKDIFI
jgi:hypothetical protein